MKRNLLIALAFLVCLSVVMWPETSVHGNGSGAPAGYTGSTFENNGRTCGTSGGCHGGGSTLQNSWITSDIPACGYTPGQTYSISVFVTSPGRTKFGFSLSPQFNSGANAGATAGTLIATNGTQLQSSGRYITHTSAGNQQNGTNSRTWTFSWTAPSSGSVTFFAAMNATNSGSNSSGDIIFNGSLVVNQNTTPALTIANTGSTEFCVSNPITLSSNIATGNAWTFNGNAAGSAASVTPSASGTYQLTNTSGTCVQTQNITVTAVNAPPTVSSITAGPAGLEICAGESTTLSATGTGLVWQPGNLSGNSITVSNAGNYTVSSTNICGTTTSNPATVVVNQLPVTPEIVVTAENGNCEGNTIVLSASNAALGDEITWSPGNIAGSEISITESGTYTVVFTNGCGESELVDQEVLFSAIPETPTISLTGEGALTTTVVAESYTWFLDGVEISGENGNTIVPVALGTYEVIASNGDDCSSALSEGFSYDPTSAAAISSAASLHVYPQPATQLITVEMSENMHADFIELFDLQGRSVLQVPTQNLQKVSISTEGIESGMYLLKIKNTTRTIVLGQ